MRFARIDIFYATLGVMPLLGLFLWWTWRERQRLITQFVQSRLLSLLTVGVSRQRQLLRLWLVAISVGATLLALSRPQWGFGYQEVKQRGLDIVIAIDTSRSMLAEDVTPNRLAKAKLAALDLRRLARTDRIGLVAFAGSAFLQMPMSVDEDAFRQHLDILDTSLLPQGGTAIAEAIQTARSAIKESGQENHQVLVMFTDGEDHDGEAIEAARAAAKSGMRIFTIGVGTANGELLRVKDAKGRSDFIKDENGNVVKSRLNEPLLQDLAKAGNGFYLQLTGARAMEVLYERGLAPLPKMDLQATLTRQYFERYQWFLGVALLLLALELFVTDRKPVTRSGALTRSASGAGALAAILILMAPLFTSASPASARRNYDSGKFKTALSEYERLIEKKPTESPLHYNAGNSAYQAGKFEAAAQHFGSALATTDPKLQQSAYYNLGNSHFRLGQESEDPKKMQELWQSSITDYETALKLDPSDHDSKQNLELVRQRLEELKKQQQQQKPGGKGDDKDKKDDQKQDPNGKDQQDQKKDSKSQQDQSKEEEKEKQKEKDQQQSQDGKKPDDKDSQKQESKGAQDSKDKEDHGQAQESKEAKGDDKKDPKDQGGAAAGGRMMQMTKQEAIQLLEALRSDERLLNLMPPKTNRTHRTLKDW